MSDFKLVPQPQDASDSMIEKLFEGELGLAKATNAAFDRLEKAMDKPPDNELWKGGPVAPSSVPEMFFHTNKRHRMEFDRVPVGHSLGYRCYDGRKHDPESAFTSGEYGDGLTEDQAYVDWLHAMDDVPAPKPGIVVHTSPFEPPTVIDVLNRSEDDDITFDDGLDKGE